GRRPIRSRRYWAPSGWGACGNARRERVPQTPPGPGPAHAARRPRAGDDGTPARRRTTHQRAAVALPPRSLLAFDDSQGLGEVWAEAVVEGFGERHGRGVAVADEAVGGMFVEMGQPVRELLAEGLDSGEMDWIEPGGEGRVGRAAGDHQDRLVAVRRALGAPAQRPADLARIDAVRQRERAELVVGDVALHPDLGVGELAADHRLVVLAQVGVPERVVAELVAMLDEPAELAGHVLGLVEEPVRRIGPRQDEERGGPTELRLLLDEVLQHADAGLGVDLELAVVLDVAELARRRVVEGQDDRRGAGRNGDPALDQRAQALQPVAAHVERLEVAAEVLRRARPALLGVV